LNPGNDRAIYRAAALQRNEARIAESKVLQCEKQIRNGLMNTFRIATYNVNSIRSRLHIIIPWLEENRPDVFCMQETKVSDVKSSSREKNNTTAWRWHPFRSWNRFPSV
jgi:hypothetical protein